MGTGRRLRNLRIRRVVALFVPVQMTPSFARIPFCDLATASIRERAMPIRRSKQQWTKLIQAFEGNGPSPEQFAESVGVSVWTFRGWLYESSSPAISTASG